MADNMPQGLDEFLTDQDPQAAIAAQGLKTIGQAALESKPVQNIITGEGLKGTYDLAGQAAQRDPQAMQQLAQHNLGAVMGSVKSIYTIPEAGPGLVQRAKAMFPKASSFEELYKLANEALAPAHPIMKALQQTKNRQLQGIAPHFADGGEIPEGLDQFISAPDPQPMVVNPTQNQTLSEIPAGLDQFIEPELKEEKYGTTGQQAITALEGAAQGLAGPLAPLAEKALGVNEEDIRNRAEVNPGTHYTSEIAGLVAPAVMTGGASVLTQAGAIERIGAEVAAKLGLGAAETLAGKIGTAAAKGAIDNMLLSGSDEVSKMILNDPNQSAHTAMIDIGLAGALGGALGGAGEAVAPLWKATVGDKVGKFIEDFKGRVNEHIDNPEPVAAMTNELSEYYKGIKGYADDVHGATGLKAQSIAKAVPQEMTPKLTDQMTEISEKLESALNKLSDDPHGRLLEQAVDKYKSSVNSNSPGEIFNASQELKQQLQEWGKYNKNLVPLSEKPFRDIAKKLGYDIRSSLEDIGVWGDAAKIQLGINRALSGTPKGDIAEGISRNVGYISALKDFEKKFTTEIAGDRVIDPTKVNTYLNQIGRPNAEIKQSMLKNFLEASEKYKGEIGKLHTNLGLESPITNSAMNVTLRSLDKKTLGSKVADAFIDKGLTDVGGKGVGGAVGAGVGHVFGHHGEIGALLGAHVLGPLFSSILPSIAKSVISATNSSTGLKAAVDYAVAVTKGETLINKAAKNIFKSGSAVLPESFVPSDKEKTKLDKMLKEIQADPEKLMNSNGQLGHYMPDHQDVISQTAGRSITYLNSLRADTSKKAPLDSKPIPSAAAKSEYNNALAIAQQPLIVLEKVQKGTVSMQDLKALTTMYPGLYARLQTKVTESMVDHVTKGETIPYRTRMGLSMFLGQPLDSTMTPEALQSIQGTYQGSAQSQQPGVVPSGKGVKSSPALQKMPQMYMTPEQSRIQHRNKP